MNRTSRFSNLNTEPLELGEDPPSEKLPEPTWIDVTKEEYDRMMKVDHQMWNRVYVNEEDAQKWFPKNHVPTPAWEEFKQQMQNFIDEMRKNS